MKNPNSDQSFIGKTIHSELTASVPADKIQSGVPNATQNHTLVRKCDVVQGNTDWILSAGTDAVNSEWIVLPINDWSELGFFNLQ